LTWSLLQVGCEQNPLLRIRLNTNDRISRIFQLLRHKWSSALDRLDANGSRRSSGPRPDVRLFAGKDTEVGRVVLNATELAPAVGLSLNKLRKEREDREALKSKRSRNAQVNTAVTVSDYNTAGISKFTRQIEDERANGSTYACNCDVFERVQKVTKPD
ncbi:hypothetical protein COOONC_03770, partial [Cooperia oncophora]